MKIRTKVQKREPANMVWDRFQLDKKVHSAISKLKARHQKNTNDSVASQDPHSS